MKNGHVLHFLDDVVSSASRNKLGNPNYVGMLDQIIASQVCVSSDSLVLQIFTDASTVVGTT